jgi:hypothetical protein
MTIDWIAKLRHLLQTMAFCLAVAAIQVALQPGKPYEVPLVYSLAIGTLTWALIDFGCHLFPSSEATGWPAGMAGLILPLFGMVLGYFGGTWLADGWFGYSSWSALDSTQLRVSIGITLLAGIAINYFFYANGKSALLLARVNEVRGQATEAQLKLLQTQLEPHMLFNTLANLRALIGSDPARAQHMLDHMVAYLRATLNASRASTHSLQAEFDLLRDYLELMAVRMGPRLRYTLTLPPELAHLSVPPLLLQPLVENAIKHGLEPQVQGGNITVSASHNGTCLTLNVLDTGVGFSGDTRREGGFGLTHVRERLATTYGVDGAIKIECIKPMGTAASVSFPCENPR